MILDRAARWDRARSLAADLVAQTIPWAEPGDPNRDPDGVDCAGAVLRLLEAAGARFPSSRLWTVESWAEPESAALANVEEIAEGPGWTLVSGPCRMLPDDLEPLDVVLSREQTSPLHVSSVVEPRGARLLTAVKPVGLCVVRRRILGPILAVYRLEGLFE